MMYRLGVHDIMIPITSLPNRVIVPSTNRGFKYPELYSPPCPTVELTVWFDDHNFFGVLISNYLSKYDSKFKEIPGEYHIHLWFEKASEAMLFKLAWGGNGTV